MNHTQRIEEVARRHRQLTRKLTKDAIDTYLALLAEGIASGEWIEIPGIGKIQVIQETGAGTLNIIRSDGQRVQRSVKKRLRTKVRLSEAFKKHCYKR